MLREQLLKPKFFVYSTLEYWAGPVLIATCESRNEAQAIVDIERRKLVKNNDVWITTEKAPAATGA